jgi:hypothetical protein
VLSVFAYLPAPTFLETQIPTPALLHIRVRTFTAFGDETVDRCDHDAIDYAKFYCQWRVIAILVYDLAGNIVKRVSQVAEDTKRLT